MYPNVSSPGTSAINVPTSDASAVSLRPNSVASPIVPPSTTAVSLSTSNLVSASETVTSTSSQLFNTGSVFNKSSDENRSYFASVTANGKINASKTAVGRNQYGKSRKAYPDRDGKHLASVIKQSRQSESPHLSYSQDPISSRVMLVVFQ